uniref:RING-type domain-containing protein n=1 Tax=Chromera velia CCMP2878 TaxID=1169474 RepID=A0A0G4F598_9ALVE|eukprot:Cvel_15285.t1-p1 / transcript=Cvel_15285.t1 / gene=Cvel_15285 / organism=Chromera_velia_CCMP2878 / gene_product=hypothetical protein / transcript_product=hypothetical protein / location=Cvel_scaffold1121:42027-44664(-) / protein_length=656 / sequence_SO=supercontig / SO=protein_coding / is_pseudo=false
MRRLGKSRECLDFPHGPVLVLLRSGLWLLNSTVLMAQIDLQNTEIDGLFDWWGHNMTNLASCFPNDKTLHFCCAVLFDFIASTAVKVKSVAATCCLWQTGFISEDEKNAVVLHFLERSLKDGLPAEKVAAGGLTRGVGMQIPDQMRRILFYADCLQNSLQLHSNFLSELAGSIFSGALTREMAQEKLEYFGVDPKRQSQTWVFREEADGPHVARALEVAAQKTDVPMLSWVLETYGKVAKRCLVDGNSATVPLGARALMGADTDRLCVGRGGGISRRAECRIREAGLVWDGKTFRLFSSRNLILETPGSSSCSAALDENDRQAIENEIKRQRGSGWGLEAGQPSSPFHSADVRMHEEEGEMGTLYPPRVLAFERLVEHLGTDVFPALDWLVDLGRVDAVEVLFRRYHIDLSTPMTDNLEEIVEAEREEEEAGKGEDVSGICHSVMVLPITLDCRGRHSFCRVCLRRVRYPSSDRPYIPCPMCREDVFFPYGHECLSDRQARALREWICREGEASVDQVDGRSEEDERLTIHQNNTERPSLWWARTWWEERGRYWSKADTLGSCMLAIASASCSIGVMEKLCKDFGMNPATATFLGRSMLQVAVTCNQVVSAKWLLHRAPSLVSLVCRENGRAPVDVAAQKGHTQMVSVLKSYMHPQ